MKKKLTFLLASLLSFALLTGCGKGNGGNSEDGSDEVAEKLVLPTGVTAFELDQTDYSKQEEKATSMIRIHYRQKIIADDYSNYVGWRIWSWDSSGGGNGWWYEFTKYDAFGVICEIPIEDVAANGTSVDRLGMVFTNCASQTATWEGSYAKEPNEDILADIKGTNPGGVQELYVKGSTPTAFYNQQSVFLSSLNYAYLSNEKTIHAVFSTTRKDFKVYKSRFTVKINGEEKTNFSLENFKEPASNSSSIDLAFTSNINYSDDVKISYRVAQDSIYTVNMLLTKIYDTEGFISKYSYTGNDLGATFDNEDNPTKTTFKVWSPVSSRMVLNIYNSGNYDTDTAPINTYEMVMDNKGVWSYTVDANLANKYYTYTVTNSAGVNEVVDPYAKSAGLNGRRGMVVNFTKLNDEIEGWKSDRRVDVENGVDASIYEIHVRDMTINPNSGVNEQYRGKFMGLTQEGTKYQGVTTGLDHLKELGITHVQIQPMYDYSSVDESTLDTSMGEDNYNWGYDPLNYNCLEGSYSTDPRDGTVRIKEAKQMIMALHEGGINTIMDVVYNHTSGLINSNFELLVPNYYHRFRTSGAAYNGSGCGNEMASERFMVNKFFRDSCKFWTDEYHLSGFRFDLMGLMDNQVMIDIYNDCKAIDSDALIYGEPWTGGSSKLSGGTNPEKLTAQQTIQGSLNASYFAGNGVLVGAFSDGIRNAVRGDNSPGKGYVTGDSTTAGTIANDMKGVFSAGLTNVQPEQVINYVSCHDNYTLYDQIVQTINTDRSLEDAYKQAEMIVFTAQGVPFMQEGEDFMRTKYDEAKQKYAGNSYNVGDLINNMDYALKAQNIEMFNFFKDLIQFRKNASYLRLATREAITNAYKSCAATGSLIKAQLEVGGKTYMIIHSMNSEDVSLDGNYKVVFSNKLYEGTLSSINMSKNTTAVLEKVA